MPLPESEATETLHYWLPIAGAIAQRHIGERHDDELGVAVRISNWRRADTQCAPLVVSAETLDLLLANDFSRQQRAGDDPVERIGAQCVRRERRAPEVDDLVSPAPLIEQRAPNGIDILDLSI